MLYNVFKKSKKYEIRETAETIIKDIAEENNLNVYEFGLKAIPNFDFDRNGERIIEVNDNKYKISLNKDYNIEILEIKENKIFKQIPKNFDDSTKEEIKYIKKKFQIS